MHEMRNASLACCTLPLCECCKINAHDCCLLNAYKAKRMTFKKHYHHHHANRKAHRAVTVAQQFF